MGSLRGSAPAPGPRRGPPRSGGAVNTGVWRCPARSSSYLEPGFGGDADQASAARPTQWPSRRGLRARPLCRTAAPRLGRTQRAPRGPGGGQWRVAVWEALFRNLTPERTFPASVRPRIPAAPDPRTRGRAGISEAQSAVFHTTQGLGWAGIGFLSSHARRTVDELIVAEFAVRRVFANASLLLPK